MPRNSARSTSRLQRELPPLLNLLMPPLAALLCLGVTLFVWMIDPQYEARCARVDSGATAHVDCTLRQHLFWFITLEESSLARVDQVAATGVQIGHSGRKGNGAPIYDYRLTLLSRSAGRSISVARQYRDFEDWATRLRSVVSGETPQAVQRELPDRGVLVVTFTFGLVGVLIVLGSVVRVLRWSVRRSA